MRIKEKDNFDRFVNFVADTWHFMEWFRKLYRHYKELMLYGLFGIGTVLISVYSYQFFSEGMRWPILVSNAVSWIFATLFAFWSNRKWVFTSHKKGVAAFFFQLASFCTGRFFTLILEEWMLFYFVQILGYPNMRIKTVAQFVVIATNYVISKLIVFRRKKH